MSRQFLMPSQIFTGSGSLIESSHSFSSFGNRAMIVTDSLMIKLGYVEQLVILLEKLSISYIVFDEVNFEPTDICITKGSNLFIDTNCEFLIGLGGGSVIDAMKAISILTTSTNSISSFMNATFNDERPAMIAIPTTAGTGSETTQFTIITDTATSVKMLIKGPTIMPDVAVIDPLFTCSAPPLITATTGIDALCHAIEGYTSKKSQGLSDIFALSAIKKIIEFLPLCFKEPSNIEAREQMALAAFEAGCAFNNSSVTIIHGMSRPIGANFHIAHGLSNAVLMLCCLTYIKEEAKEKFANIARYINVSSSNNSDVASDAFLNCLANLLECLQIPKLSEIIEDHEKFLSLVPKMSSDAIQSGSPGNTLKTINSDDIQHIYRSLFNKA